MHSHHVPSPHPGRTFNCSCRTSLHIDMAMNVNSYIKIDTFDMGTSTLTFCYLPISHIMLNNAIPCKFPLEIIVT